MDQIPLPDRFDRQMLAALRGFARLGSVATTLFGLATLLDWLYALHTASPPLAVFRMTPTSASGCVVGGLALLLRLSPAPGRAARGAQGLGAALSVGSAAMLAGYLLTGRDLVDPALVAMAGPAVHGEHLSMAPVSLICFMLLGLAAAAPAEPGRATRWLFDACCPLGLVISALSILGHAYDVTVLHALTSFQDMGRRTAAGLMVLFLCCLASTPQHGWVAPIASGRPAARNSRGQLTLAISTPFLIGLIALNAQRRGLVTPGLAMAAVVAGTALVLAVRILHDGHALDLLDQDRQRAVAAQERLTAELEERVRERTASLARSEARLRSYFDNAPEGLVLFRVATDGSTYVDALSPSMQTLYGLHDAAGGRLELEALLAADDLSDLRRQIANCLASGKPHRYTTRRMLDGKHRLMDVILAPVAATPGEADRLIAGSIRDITEAEAREETLRQSQKMEAVGQLTGGLAHDFNNLLTGITGSLELMTMRINKGRTEDLSRYIDTAQAAASRAAALTHRLLAFSRRQTLDPRDTDVRRVVADMAELIRRTVGPHVVVSLAEPDPDEPADACTALVDANQLENALLNLCLNARDAMPDGGALAIGVEPVRVQAGGASGLPEGEHVRLFVRDTGIGMSPETAARAFDPFFTTKPIGQGTGLGLSMIHGFVHQSGGEIRLLSEPGCGTTVTLLLPRRGQSMPSGSADSQAAPDAVDGAGLSGILVVDDEVSVREVVVELLAEFGYRVTQAADAAEGLVILRSEARIDLLVSDVGLPGAMNGRQLADAARVMRPSLSVLFITGYAEAAVLSSGDLETGMEVLTKPFSIGTLTQRVQALLAARPTGPASGQPPRDRTPAADTPPAARTG